MKVNYIILIILNLGLLIVSPAYFIKYAKNNSKYSGRIKYLFLFSFICLTLGAVLFFFKFFFLHEYIELRKQINIFQIIVKSVGAIILILLLSGMIKEN